MRPKKYHGRHMEAVYTETYLGPSKISIVEHTAQKMKFSINDFFSKCDQIHSQLRILWNITKLVQWIIAKVVHGF